ncbi:MAG: hypothetical protein R6U13_08680 [Desulfatiglandaceae bacterium]
MFLAGCGGRSSNHIEPNYTATIEEGRTAAKEILDKTGANSMIVGFCADGRIVWTEGFGYAEREKFFSMSIVPPLGPSLHGEQPCQEEKPARRSGAGSD